MRGFLFRVEELGMPFEMLVQGVNTRFKSRPVDDEDRARVLELVQVHLKRERQLWSGVDEWFEKLYAYLSDSYLLGKRAGDEVVSIEEWCAYLGEITGMEPKFNYTDQTLASLPLDVTKLGERVGRARVHWRDGIRRMVEARNPELIRDGSVE